MTKLKPGDRVRCVDDFRFTTVVCRGAEYTVDNVVDGPPRIRLRENGFWFMADRFELVQPAVDIDAICRGEWPAGTRVRCVDDDHYAA